MNFRSVARRLADYLGVLLVLTLLAAACGSSSSVLEGDTAATAGQSDPSASTVTPQAQTEAQTEATPIPVAESTTAAADDPTDEPEIAVVVGDDETNGRTVATGGAVDQINGTEFRIGNSTAVAADLRTYIAGAPEPDRNGATWLITDIEMTTSTRSQIETRPSTFSIEGPDGTRYEGDTQIDSRNEIEFSIRRSGSDYTALRVAFPTDTLIADASDWNLVVDAGNSIPLVLPLSGSQYTHQYPIFLTDGSEARISVADFGGCSAGAEFDTKVELTRIDVEGALSFDNIERMPVGERAVGIQLALTGLDASNSVSSSVANCGVVGLWDDFLLMVDGRPTQPATQYTPDIEDVATVSIQLNYQIPSDAKRLELVGGNDGGTTIATWNVDLPIEVGEPGAELVHFSQALTLAPDAILAGPRPGQLTTTVVAPGGAVDQRRLVEYTVGESIATNATPASLLANAPELDDQGRTWLVTELSFEETLDDRNIEIAARNVVLYDPLGRPYGAVNLYDRTGDQRTTVFLNGIEYEEGFVSFETDGLVSDPTGWTIQIESENTIPFVMPLDGPAYEPEYPIALRHGSSATLTSDVVFNCDEGLLEATVTYADVAIEGWGDFENRWIRSSEPQRYINIHLGLTDLTNERSCASVIHWPEFLLVVDGRPTQSLDRAFSGVGPSGSDTLRLMYVIPEETQTISLLGGDGIGIATWDLKNPGEVLNDFGAMKSDERTLITLDETLLFAFGESTLQQSAFAPLVRVANVLNSESSGQVQIVGHTDAIGDDASNQRLSLARAEAVAAALVDAGVDVSRLEVSGEGESVPIAPNTNDDGSDNPAGRELNRRVEIYFDTTS